MEAKPFDLGSLTRSDMDSIMLPDGVDIKDLPALVENAIAELFDETLVTNDGTVESLQATVKHLERRHKEINKLLSDCMKKLTDFQISLEEDIEQEEAQYKELKKLQDSSGGYPGEITITSSDVDEDEEEDDDVQFIQKTFDPTIVKKRQGETSSSSPIQSHRANFTAALNKASHQAPPRTLDSVRRVFSASLPNQSDGKRWIKSSVLLQHLRNDIPQSAWRAGLENMPSSSSLSSSSLSSPIPLIRVPNVTSGSKMVPLQPATQNALSALQQRRPGISYMQSSQANLDQMEKLFSEDISKLKEGSLVLARRSGDMWQRAVLTEPPSNEAPVEYRKYKVSYIQKKSWKKTLGPKLVAFSEYIKRPVLVGTRIVALYKDEASDDAFYAGIVAEAPNGRNELRYLVFFDDGYAQYCTAKEIHKVFYQSRDVWNDIHPDSQDFVRDYLAQYPERPMVRLHKGQTVKTEWKGKWWTAKVEEVDASLALMYFPADKRGEWIYRGSTRLEPLYTALAKAEANRQGGKVKRHNLNMAGPKKPVVEYTRTSSTDASPGKADRKKAVAKKSTTPSAQTSAGAAPVWEPNWPRKLEDKKPSLKLAPQDKFTTSTISAGTIKGKDIASVLQDRLTGNVTEDTGTGAVDLESFGTRRDHIINSSEKTRKKMVPHTCSPACLNGVDDDPEKLKGHNPLLIPLFYGWERHVAKTKPSGRRVVFYRAPCARRLRSLEELDIFLAFSDSKLMVDNFCWDAELHVHYEFIPVKTFCDIKDLSYGKENVVISCVNGIDRQYPDYVDYSNQRSPAAGVKLNLDPDFLVCCDCTDNCRDRSKCKCQQLTVESSAIINGGKPDHEAGYHFRRLPEPLISGVYECNSRCKCDKRCRNRVVQTGLTNRLQVFKTEKRGWGLRCLDDIPRGGFICIYAGQLLTDQGANEDGQQYGDEYLAELDYIEVVERLKEGYESDVEDIDEMDKDDDYESESDNANASDSDESFKGSISKSSCSGDGVLPAKCHQTRRKSQRDIEKTDSKGDDPVRSTESLVKKKQTAQKSTSNAGNKPPPDLPDLEYSPDAGGEKKRRTGRSTGARYGTLNPSKKDVKDEDKAKEEPPPSMRDYFEDDTECYIMDAKSMGNIGRYLNHSCIPNAFVQNVFVDTHDLRFPWIAFFAGQYISAGTELTWDYNYEVGSVPGKCLYCYCGAAECRGRLL